MGIRALGLTTALLVVFASGCGSGGDAAVESDGGVTTITIGLSKSANSISGYLAAEKFAEAAGLKFKVVTVNSGAEAIPMLLNGSLDVSLGDALATMTASANGVPLTALGVSSIAPSDPGKDPSGIFAAGSATIATLAGKKVAVPALKGAPELIARAGIDAAGGDSSKVTLVELATQSTIPAIQSGDVAAGLVFEPFTTAASEAGLTELGRPLADAFAGLPVTLWISSKKFADQHPDLVQKFLRAAHEGDRAANDVETARASAATFMDMDAAILDAIRLPSFVDQQVDTAAALEKLIALAERYDLLAKRPDLDALVAAPAGS